VKEGVIVDCDEVTEIRVACEPCADVEHEDNGGDIVDIEVLVDVGNTVHTFAAEAMASKTALLASSDLMADVELVVVAAAAPASVRDELELEAGLQSYLDCMNRQHAGSSVQ
jgi:hypothetical protein